MDFDLSVGNTSTANGHVPKQALDDTEQEGVNAGEDKASNSSLFLPYDPSTFSMAQFFRPQADIVASYIVQSGMEGIDRYEISRRLGINAECKAGNRIVSASIHSAIRNFPNQIGEYHKMEGRFRVKKYYLKSAKNAPGGKALSDLMDQFKALTGIECPFKLGEVLKFPGQNLNTLRISDITLKRLVQVIEYVQQEKAVITVLRLTNHLTNKEHEEGYKFTIDRRSMRKLLLVLQKHNLLNMFELEVNDERNIRHKVEVVTVPEITAADDPRIQEALAKVQMEFKENSKSFPTGHLLKKEPVEEEEEAAQQNAPEIQQMEEGDGERTTAGIKQEQMEEGPEPAPPPGSLLYNTFTKLERMQFQQKYRKNASPLAVLSQKSLNSLVEAAKRRRMSRGTKKPQITKKIKTETGEAEESFTAGSGSSPLAKKRVRTHEGRLVDNVDRISLQHKAYLRSRFTQRERDMLLLIRACSFFLNPISRFWPHPKVMRNLMHEFVPESRTKTTYSLMAAGVRETKERQSQQQYTIKTLASFPELLELRNRLAQMNLSSQVPVAGDDDLRPKDLFFVDAFRKAYQILFKETADFPSIQVDDRTFQNYLNTNNLHFLQVSENDKQAEGTIPTRSQAPADEKDVRSSVAFNAIMLIMHNENDHQKEEPSQKQPELAETEAANEQPASSPVQKAQSDLSNFIFEQFELDTLSETIEKIRADGLITRKRPVLQSSPEKVEANEEETQADGIAENSGTAKEGEATEEIRQTRGTLRLTQYYHHYFDSGLQRNLPADFYSMASRFMQQRSGKKETATFAELEDPSEFLCLANMIADGKKNSIKLTTPNSLNDLFVLKKAAAPALHDDLGTQRPSTSKEQFLSEDILKTASATKQLRYLEDSELRLERLKIQPIKFDKQFTAMLANMPRPEDLVGPERLVPEAKLPKSTPTDEEQVQQQTEHEIPNELRPLFDAIDRAGVLGIAEEDLMDLNSGPNFDEFHTHLDSLLNTADVIVAGVDQRRFVSTRNGKAWLLQSQLGHWFVPKPWSLPSGQTNWNVLGWMLEGIFAFVYASPCLPLEDLITHFSLVLQPIYTMELLEMLVKLDCCTILTREVQPMRKASPFESTKNQRKTCKLVQPCANGIEKIAFFKHKLANDTK